jgi:hypothetical protein
MIRGFPHLCQHLETPEHARRFAPPSNMSDNQHSFPSGTEQQGGNADAKQLVSFLDGASRNSVKAAAPLTFKSVNPTVFEVLGPMTALEQQRKLAASLVANNPSIAASLALAKAQALAQPPALSNLLNPEGISRNSARVAAPLSFGSVDPALLEVLGPLTALDQQRKLLAASVGANNPSIADSLALAQSQALALAQQPVLSNLLNLEGTSARDVAPLPFGSVDPALLEVLGPLTALEQQRKVAASAGAINPSIATSLALAQAQALAQQPVLSNLLNLEGMSRISSSARDVAPLPFGSVDPALLEVLGPLTALEQQRKLLAASAGAINPSVDASLELAQALALAQQPILSSLLNLEGMSARDVAPLPFGSVDPALLEVLGPLTALEQQRKLATSVQRKLAAGIFARLSGLDHQRNLATGASSSDPSIADSLPHVRAQVEQPPVMSSLLNLEGMPSLSSQQLLTRGGVSQQPGVNSILLSLSALSESSTFAPEELSALLSALQQLLQQGRPS